MPVAASAIAAVAADVSSDSPFGCFGETWRRREGG